MTSEDDSLNEYLQIMLSNTLFVELQGLESIRQKGMGIRRVFVMVIGFSPQASARSQMSRTHKVSSQMQEPLGKPISVEFMTQKDLQFESALQTLALLEDSV